MVKTSFCGEWNLKFGSNFSVVILKPNSTLCRRIFMINMMTSVKNLRIWLKFHRFEWRFQWKMVLMYKMGLLQKGDWNYIYFLTIWSNWGENWKWKKNGKSEKSSQSICVREKKTVSQIKTVKRVLMWIGRIDHNLRLSQVAGQIEHWVICFSFFHWVTLHRSSLW